MQPSHNKNDKSKFLEKWPLTQNERTERIEALLILKEIQNQLKEKVRSSLLNLQPDQLIQNNQAVRDFILNEITCSNCQLIVRDPVDCNECDTTVCLHCAQGLQAKNQGCKECKSTSFTFKRVHSKIKQMLSEQKFKCHFSQCKDQHDYKAAIEHINSCEYREIQCIQQCNQYVLPSLMELHCLRDCKNSQFKQEQQKSQKSQKIHVGKIDIDKLNLLKGQTFQEKKEQLYQASSAISSVDKLSQENQSLRRQLNELLGTINQLGGSERQKEQSINQQDGPDFKFTNSKSNSQEEFDYKQSKKYSQNEPDETTSQIAFSGIFSNLSDDTSFCPSALVDNFLWNMLTKKMFEILGKKLIINNHCLTISEYALKKGNLKEKGILKSVWNYFHDSSGALILIKTNFNYLIGIVLPTRIENTSGLKYNLDGKKYTDGKVMDDSIVFYLVNNKLVTCRWRNKVNPNMASDEDNLFFTQGIWIENDRSKQDCAFLRDIQFKGMEQADQQYPMKISAAVNTASAYIKKGYLSDYYCIAGGENSFFKALTVEFFALSF